MEHNPQWQVHADGGCRARRHYASEEEVATGEVTALKRAEEPIKPTKYTSLLDQLEDTFNALSNSAYEIFESTGRAFGRDLDNWFQAEREMPHPVHVHIVESDGSLEVKAEVSGFSEKELEIGLEPRRLTITGKRETKKEEKRGKTVLYRMLLGPSPAHRGPAPRCREGQSHRDTEERCFGVGAAKSGQSANNPNPPNITGHAAAGR